jgi:hypothetical protein
MDSRTCLIILLALACIALCAAGCTTTTTIGNPAPAQTATPAAAATNAGTAIPAAVGTVPAAAALPVPTTTPCPDKLVWNGNWDSREVGYASNHDVRDEGVWTDAGPVPVTLTQKCWDVTGTFKVGDCEDGKLTGKIEKNTLSGTYTENCAAAAGLTTSTFSLTMAADNQSFIGYKYNYYGPDTNFPPSWWGKKIA